MAASLLQSDMDCFDAGDEDEDEQDRRRDAVRKIADELQARADIYNPECSDVFAGGTCTKHRPAPPERECQFIPLDPEYKAAHESERSPERHEVLRCAQCGAEAVRLNSGTLAHVIEQAGWHEPVIRDAPQSPPEAGLCGECGRPHFNSADGCRCTFPVPEGDDSEAVRGLQLGKSYGIAIDLDDYQFIRQRQPKGSEETADVLITYRDQRVTMSFEDFARIVGIEFEPDTQDQSRN